MKTEKEIRQLIKENEDCARHLIEKLISEPYEYSLESMLSSIKSVLETNMIYRNVLGEKKL